MRRLIVKDRPFVSIITVVYNGERYIEQTIQNVLNQSYNNIEYIIIDGGSIDGTIDIIRKYDDKISYWISEKDRGVYDAMNKGIQVARGELIGIINSDDYYELDAVSNVVEAYLNNDKPDILFGDMIMIWRNSMQKIINASIGNLKFNMTINHPTCFVKSDLYRERLFNIGFNIASDYELMLYFYTKNKRFFYIHKILANMRDGGISDAVYKTAKETFNIQCKYISKISAIRNYLLRISKRLFRDILSIFISEERIAKLRGYK